MRTERRKIAQDKVGILVAVFRYFRFWNWRRARYIIEAADEQFTGSVDGIDAAFEMHRDELVLQFSGLRDSIAQLEAVLEEKRSRLRKVDEEEIELIQKREGALALVARSNRHGTEYEMHAAAFGRFQARIDEIEQIQQNLRADTEESSDTMNRYMLRLSEMQAEVERLPAQRAEAIADFVSAKQIIELNERLNRSDSLIDRGPVQAVLDANRVLSAKARSAEQIVATDGRAKGNEYMHAGRVTTDYSKMAAMRMAHLAEKDQREEASARGGAVRVSTARSKMREVSVVYEREKAFHANLSKIRRSRDR